MPKQVWKIDKFHGGLNTYDGNSDIAEDECDEAQDIIFDNVGEIVSMGSKDAHPDIGTSTVIGSVQPGYGSFHMGVDNKGGYNATAGSGAYEMEDDLIFTSDPANTGKVYVYSRLAANQGTPINGGRFLNGSQTMLSQRDAGPRRDLYFAADGAVRICDARLGNRNELAYPGQSSGGDSVWYGHVRNRFWKSSITDDGNTSSGDGWYVESQAIRGMEYLREEALASAGEAVYNTLNQYISGGAYDDLTVNGGIPYVGVTLSASGSGGYGWGGKEWYVGYSYIYDGAQESPLCFDSTAIDLTADGTDEMGNIGVYIPKVNNSNQDVYKYFNKRITGVNIYLREGGSSSWLQALHVSFEKGAMHPESGEPQWWSTYSGTGNRKHWKSLAAGIKYPPSTLTFEASSGFSSDAGTTHCRYKTAVIANRRSYVGHLRYVDKAGVIEMMGDAMIKSPTNCFDTHPKDRILEVSVRDGDHIVKLEEYADRILQFKKEKMHLINISQASEFLEDTFMQKGIDSPNMACKTDYGVAWANRHGCYLYDGKSVIDLLEKKGMRKISQEEWSDFIIPNDSDAGINSSGAGSYGPVNHSSMIGYIPQSKALIVVKSNNSGYDDHIYRYDMRTGSWTFGLDKFRNTSGTLSNFFYDWDQRLCWQEHHSGTTSRYFWNDKPGLGDANHWDWSYRSKLIDFGHPSVRKKVYKMYMSYKGPAISSSLIDVQWQPDDASTWYSTNINSSGVSATAIEDSIYQNDEVIEISLEDPSNKLKSLKRFRFRVRITGIISSAIKHVSISDFSIVYRLKSIK